MAGPKPNTNADTAVRVLAVLLIIFLLLRLRAWVAMLGPLKRDSAQEWFKKRLRLHQRVLRKIAVADF